MFVFLGDCADLLQREPVVVGSDHADGTAPLEPTVDHPAAGGRRGHQSDHRFLQLRTLLRHLLQVLGAGQGPRSLHRQERSRPPQRSRYLLPHKCIHYALALHSI